MNHAGDERRIRSPLDQHLAQMFRRARAPRGDDGNADAVRHARGDGELVALLGTVRVDGVETDFPRAEGFGALCPFDRIDARPFASPP